MRSYKVCVPYALSFAALFAVNSVTAQQVAASPLPEPSSLSSATLPGETPFFQRAISDLDERREAVAEQAPKLSGAAQRQFLERTLSQALEETANVESRYRDDLKGEQIPDHDSELFDAVRTRYHDAEHDVDSSGKFLHSVQLHRGGATPLAETLSALSYNEHVYRSITGGTAGLFDLQVVSNPAGAKITYWSNGSDEVRQADSVGTIAALPVSVWFVKAEVPGHAPIVQTYDAYVETNGKLFFDFTGK